MTSQLVIFRTFFHWSYSELFFLSLLSLNLKKKFQLINQLIKKIWPYSGMKFKTGRIAGLFLPLGTHIIIMAHLCTLIYLR